jgi:DNA polymerase (family 10)
MKTQPEAHRERAIYSEPATRDHQKGAPQYTFRADAMTTNQRIAQLLTETADLMEIAQEDGFRIRSYRNAAAAIEGHPQQMADIAASDPGKLTAIKGIGKGIAFVIGEILERGSFERRDEMLTRYPPTALELLKIQGLGPKSIALLWEHYRVSTVDQLEALCREGKLRDLPRMGQKLEEKVLRSIETYRRGAGRFLLSHADAVAQDLGLAGGGGDARGHPCRGQFAS